MFALRHPRHHNAANGQIVAFRAPGRENDIAGFDTQLVRDDLSRVFHGMAGCLAFLVETGGIREMVREIRLHRLKNFGVYRRCGVIVEIGDH